MRCQGSRPDFPPEISLGCLPTRSPNPRFPYISYNDDSASAVYQHKLKFQGPTTIPWKPHLQNSVHFIGSVDRSPQLVHSGDGHLLVPALLHIREASDSEHWFRTETLMSGKFAASCVRYLKADDYIYVSGRLKSYPKADEHGNLRLCYRVNVGELNYVVKPGQVSGEEKSGKQQLEEGNASFEHALETFHLFLSPPFCVHTVVFLSDKLPDEAKRQKYTSQLHLWQVFFASPEEWRDNRKDKRSPGAPDLKHKDTGEALWLLDHDPPWVKRQLELLDTTSGKSCDEYVDSRPGISQWYDIQTALSNTN